MRLEKAILLKKKGEKKDILEILGINMLNNYTKKYYTEKIKILPKGNYFISDLDGTFFRGTLQKEAVSLFIKFVSSKNFYNRNPEEFYEFLKDLEFFNSLEKKAFNKEIDFGEYLNAGIFLLMKHKNLVEWEKFLLFIENSFISKEKVKPFRFSIKKVKEVLENNDIFLFVSGAPDFILEIYLSLLKSYIFKNLGEKYSKNIYGFGTHISLEKDYFCPLFGIENKKNFINLLKEKNIIEKTTGGMGDTKSDFGISLALDDGSDFYFINPEKSVLENFEKLKNENINYKMIFERKDLICEFEKEKIKFL